MTDKPAITTNRLPGTACTKTTCVPSNIVQPTSQCCASIENYLNKFILFLNLVYLYIYESFYKILGHKSWIYENTIKVIDKNIEKICLSILIFTLQCKFKVIQEVREQVRG